jgi:galactoside O-acetyltransferase
MKTSVVAAGLKSFAFECVFALLRSNRSQAAESLRRRLYRTCCFIDADVVISNRKQFEAGPATALYHGCYILNPHGQFAIGSNSHLGAFCFVNVCYGNVLIGEHVAIGPGTKLFAYSNHYRTGSKITAEKITADITIGDNVFIGANCVILPGTRIGNNVVVGAGSVVKGELLDDCMYAGAPCRIVRRGWYTGSSVADEYESLR